MRAVRPSLVAAVTSACLARRLDTIWWWPLFAAMINAVHP
jgi:hypothetical protein